MIDVNKLIDLVKEAGTSILEIYDAGDFEKTIDFKTDNSPLTLADKASHEIL